MTAFNMTNAAFINSMKSYNFKPLKPSYFDMKPSSEFYFVSASERWPIILTGRTPCYTRRIIEYDMLSFRQYENQLILWFSEAAQRIVMSQFPFKYDSAGLIRAASYAMTNGEEVKQVYDNLSEFVRTTQIPAMALPPYQAKNALG